MIFSIMEDAQKGDERMYGAAWDVGLRLVSVSHELLHIER